jgi:hypothetical protein
MEINLSSKIPKKYCCKICDYNTSYSKDFNKHLLTKKHKEMNGNKEEKYKFLACKICKKEFKTNAGLWKHNKKCIDNDCALNKYDNIIDCKSNNENETADDISNTKLIEYLMKENKEIKEMILEIVKNGTMNNSHNTTTNSHNKSFNLQFFLNETCKDAMNLMDFVDSIKLQLSDLEKMGEIGYTQGISNIITTNLKALDVTQRPVHCTDKKRGIMYIKDENKWEKEDDEKTKLRNLIIRVSNKNIKLLPQFREKYPDYKVSTSRTSDKYDKIVLEAMGGSGDNDKEKTEKIIQNISKCVVIDKYE